MVMAPPRETWSPYSRDSWYPSRQLPVRYFVDVKDSALRCCHARFSPLTRFNVEFTTWSGRGDKSAMGTLSLGSKPVNGCSFRRLLDAPRNVRISRTRYMACSENLLASMNQERIKAGMASSAASRSSTSGALGCWTAEKGFQDGGFCIHTVSRWLALSSKVAISPTRSSRKTGMANCGANRDTSWE